MADFALWATAAESGYTDDVGSFLRAYMGNRTDANDLALTASPIVGPIIALLETREQWTGIASDLLAELNAIVSEDVKHQRDWPKSPQGIGGALKRLAPNLRSTGINISNGTGRSRCVITIEKTGNGLSQMDHSSQKAIANESDENARNNQDSWNCDLSRALTPENSRLGRYGDNGDGCDKSGREFSGVPHIIEDHDSHLNEEHNDELEELAARLEYQENLPRDEAELRARELYDYA